MVKVKKAEAQSKSISKFGKKSKSIVHSNKSSKILTKAITSVLPTVSKLKNKKTLDNFNVTVADELSSLKQKSKVKKSQPKTKLKKTDCDPIAETFKEKYNINIEDIKSAVQSVIQLHLNNPKLKKQLFGTERFSIDLSINCLRIPSGHPTILRIPLKNTLITPEDEICLIVSEVKGIGNKEHEKHIEHYEELLSRKGVTNINKIMTVHELRTEYETFEQKSRLVDLYDAFLVCGKVSGRVVGMCGKKFYKKRKVPTAVKLQSNYLKEHIDKQLSKSFCHLHLKGDCYNVRVGHSKMEVQQIVENVISVVEYLDEKFPGGFENIKGLHISAERSTSIPIYMSIKHPKHIPKVKVKKSNQKFVPKVVEGELSTQLNAKVLVMPSGRVIVKKKKHRVNADK
ncbi:ribosomal L1 domain-containing protein 1-like [Diorhabda carinulata]|uniref:ribosomal L1 domain-containing protein 1-like n=1 Tax=Diorhabda carinulata TaxID=1163345 RepID=UPI0025A0696D|nr:ribosomal L1 domain-containing protein 1-like [Diorhabda carinulata]